MKDQGFQKGDRAVMLDGYLVRKGTIEAVSKIDGEVKFRFDDNGDAFWYPNNAISPIDADSNNVIDLRPRE